MRPIILLAFATVTLAGCETRNRDSVAPLRVDGEPRSSVRTVDGNVLDSPAIPNVAIRVDSSFVFAGSFDIEILANADEWSDSLVGKPIAAGERFLFVDAGPDKSVSRLLIVQFEGFLDNNDQTYNYSFADAEVIGENRYRHNTWFYDSREQAAQNPSGEGARTRAFLAGNGYELEDEHMMSRFVALASADRRNEMIIYYIEMLRCSTGLTLAEWEALESGGGGEDILRRFVDRSRSAFDIVRG